MKEVIFKMSDIAEQLGIPKERQHYLKEEINKSMLKNNGNYSYILREIALLEATLEEKVMATFVFGALCVKVFK